MKRKTEERTEWQGQSESRGERRRKKKWQTCWCCRDQRKAGRMAQASLVKLQQTEPAEKKRETSVPQSEQFASMPELPLPIGKGTEQSVQITGSLSGREST